MNCISEIMLIHLDLLGLLIIIIFLHGLKIKLYNLLLQQYWFDNCPQTCFDPQYPSDEERSIESNLEISKIGMIHIQFPFIS